MLTTQMIREIMIEEDLLDEAATSAADDLDLIRHGIVDSIGIIKIVLSVEKKYGINVQVEDITKEDFLSVNAILNFYLRFIVK